MKGLTVMKLGVFRLLAGMSPEAGRGGKSSKPEHHPLLRKTQVTGFDFKCNQQ